jgi:Pyridoxal-phosphate dependent enzyme
MLTSVLLRSAARKSSSTTSATALLRTASHDVNNRPTSLVRFKSAATTTTDSDDDDFADNNDHPTAATPPPPQVTTPSSGPYRGKLYDDLPITFADISRAEVAIRGGVVRTYCEHSPFISELIDANVYFKGEYKQFTGSFKERGARNAILTLMRQLKSDLRGVIAASAGNHAQALAYHGMLLGVPATVVMPVVAPLAKVDKCRVSDFLCEKKY